MGSVKYEQEAREPNHPGHNDPDPPPAEGPALPVAEASGAPEQPVAEGAIGGGDGTDLLSLTGEPATLSVPLLGEDGLLAGGGDIGSLLSAAMLDVDNFSASVSGAGPADGGADVYDGNVSLAGDLGPALDSALDMLTTTTSLFDVPALDSLIGDGTDS